MTTPNYVTLLLNLYDGTGALINQGSVKLAPSVSLQDAADLLDITPAPIWSAMNGIAVNQVRLLATDNANVLPSGWAWTVSFPGLPGNPASENIFLPAAPQTFTANSATPCTFTASGAGYPNNTGVQLSGGSLPAGFSAGTVYWTVAGSGATFQLAATAGGAPVASTSTGSGSVIAVSSYLSSLAPVSSVTSMAAYMPLPSGTAAPGQVPVATGSGEASAWGTVLSNPMTTSGDTIYGGSAGAPARLAGDTSNTRKFLREQSSDAVAQPPAWDTIQAGDVPTLNQNTTGNAATATNLAGGATLPAYVAPKVVTLTDGSNVAVDASAGNVFDWPLGGSPHTLAAPSNAVDGDVIVLRIGYSGSFTPLFNAIYDFNGSPPAWTAASGKEDEAAFRYRAASSKWRYQGSMLGFTS